MTLRDPETRKALRAIVGAVIALGLLAFVAWQVHRVAPSALAGLLLFALGIIGLRVLFDGAENVTNAVNFKWNQTGAEGSVTPPQAAQAVADAAQDKADDVKGAVK